VIVLEPASGRVLAYASTDVRRFPPTRTYPAASLVKVITAAAALEHDPERARLPCRFQGSPYRLTPARLDPPRRGNTVTLERALATSNNQCFAQLAVHALGIEPLREAIGRFGWLAAPAPGHEAGEIGTGEDRYAVGRLGCGLDGCRITPLHAAQLAAVLARGERVAPRWIERVLDAEGNEVPLPTPAAARPVLSPERAAELREMLAETTTRGTARSAFRDRRGHPRLGPVRVAGKTGSLSGTNPSGRYEWFAGAAPVERPSVAVAVVVVQSHTWWRSASGIAADVLAEIFCSGRSCGPELVQRFTRAPASAATGRLATR
jgi:cell division protein FtsI/penicillin-binding protein 2